MKSKSFALLLFSIILSLSISSCSPAQVADIPTRQPITETPKPAATKTKTSTPQATSTEMATPTPEVVFHELITELKDFPIYTAEQEHALIQKAIETMSVQKPADDNGRIQISEFIWGEYDFGEGVKVISNPSSSFLFRDSYQVIIHTDKGDLPVHKVLIELYVTFEDGRQGSVVMPLILTHESETPGTVYDRTQKRVDFFNKILAEQKISFHFLTKLDSSHTTNPVILTLLSNIDSNEQISSLLDKAHTLAQDGKFLSQAEINIIINYIMYF